MCLYWKKQYTCDHLSGRHVELCRQRYSDSTLCADMDEDEQIRKSYFPCFDCIREEVRKEAAEKANADQQAANKARETREQAQRDRLAAEKRAKEDRIRNEARVKAAREREEEARAKAIREQEMERARKEGGQWIETNSGRKGKGRKAGGFGGGSPSPSPINPSPTSKTILSKDKKENEAIGNSGSKGESKDLNVSGRAGFWGPKHILSRKDKDGLKN